MYNFLGNAVNICVKSGYELVIVTESRKLKLLDLLSVTITGVCYNYLGGKPG